MCALISISNQECKPSTDGTEGVTSMPNGRKRARPHHRETRLFMLLDAIEILAACRQARSLISFRATATELFGGCRVTGADSMRCGQGWEIAPANPERAAWAKRGNAVNYGNINNHHRLALIFSPYSTRVAVSCRQSCRPASHSRKETARIFCCATPPRASAPGVS